MSRLLAEQMVFNKMRVALRVILLLTLLNTTKANKQEKELNLNFFQNDYQIKFERAELVRYNKYYLKDVKVVTFKFNRTHAVANATWTFNIDMGYQLNWVIQAYKFTSNEYREFPLRFQANLCKLLAANAAGSQNALKCGNFTGCPLVNGKTFHICNFYPDQSKLPPYIPNGEFKLQMELVYLSVEILVLDIYGTIFRPVLIPN